MTAILFLLAAGAFMAQDGPDLNVVVQKRVVKVAEEIDERRLGYPSFVDLPNGNSSHGPRFRVFNILTEPVTSSSVYPRLFEQSAVHVLGSSFTGCSAIGHSVFDGSGGAIMASDSSLLVRASTFESCVADLGGALSRLNTETVVTDSLFHRCSAYFQGGGHYQVFGDDIVWRSGIQFEFLFHELHL
jgi:hypothetical protein